MHARALHRSSAGPPGNQQWVGAGALPLAGVVVAALVVGSLAGSSPRVLLPILVLLVLLRVAVTWPAVLVGLFVGAVFLRVPELVSVSADLPRASTHLLTLSVLALGLWRWRTTGRPPAAAGVALLLIAASAASVLLSVFPSPDPRSAVVGAGLLLLDATVALAVVLVVRDRRDVMAALWGLVAAGLLVAGAGLGQMLLGLRGDLGGLAHTSVSTLAGETTGYRLGGQFGDANFFAQALVVVVAAALALAALPGAPPARALAALTCGVASLAVLFTYSRGGLVVLVLLLAAAALRLRRVRRWLVAGVLLVAVALAVLPWQQESPLQALVDRAEFSSSDPSVRQRARGLQTAAHMFAAHPLVGVGHDSYDLRQADFAPSATLSEPRDPPLPPHSLYLHVAAETGAVGLAALLALALVPLHQLRRGPSGARADSALRWGVAACLVAYFAAAALLPRAYPRHLWLVVGLALAAAAVLAADSRARANRAGVGA